MSLVNSFVAPLFTPPRVLVVEILQFADGSRMETSPTDTGVTSVAAVGSTPAAAGASISGSVLTLQPASATLPGVLTAGAQAIGGSKTFSGDLIPATNTTYDLGTTSLYWDSAYINNAVLFSGLYTGPSAVLTITGATRKYIPTYVASGAAGTSANTNNFTSGRFTLASGQTTFTMTNDQTTATSVVLVQIETAIGAAISYKVVPGSSQFVLTTAVAAPTDLVFSFLVVGA